MLKFPPGRPVTFPRLSELEICQPHYSGGGAFLDFLWDFPVRNTSPLQCEGFSLYTRRCPSEQTFRDRFSSRRGSLLVVVFRVSLFGPSRFVFFVPGEISKSPSSFQEYVVEVFFHRTLPVCSLSSTISPLLLQWGFLACFLDDCVVPPGIS